LEQGKSTTVAQTADTPRQMAGNYFAKNGFSFDQTADAASDYLSAKALK
jgi:hypothetical protein